MKQPIHILYLSGFNVGFDPWRLRMLKLWRFRNVTVEFVPLRWEGQESFEQKVARVDQAIDRAAGKQVVVIGESAGGAMAVYMYARRPDAISKAMTICGKNIQPETVDEIYYDRSPAFRSAMGVLDESLDKLTNEQRQKFVSIHPLYDEIVPVRETLVPECRSVRLWLVGHQPTIISCLTFLSPIVIRAARSQKEEA